MVNITHITFRVPKNVKHPQMDFFTCHTGKLQHTICETVLIVAPRVDGTTQTAVKVSLPLHIAPEERS